MKKNIVQLLPLCLGIFLLTFTADAQNTTTTTTTSGGPGTAVTSQTSPDSWVEMEEFQKLLTSTYSAAEKGDMTPIRKQSDQLTKLSITMAKSSMPAINDNVEMRTLLGEFTDRCEEFGRFLQDGRTDTEIFEQFTKLKDSYQEILSLRQKQQTEKQ